MCGIAGIVSRRPINPKAIHEMTSLMAHRGPDGQGHWTSAENTIALGHRRLSVIDLSELGHQPMADHTGNYTITFNGEIYNYIELKRKLQQTGSCFNTNSDTEVILEAYKVWGTKCLDFFNGMFAFAIYDKQKNRLFCARDRYGEKPFLFFEKDSCFVFASEYKALLHLKECDDSIDELKLVISAYIPGKGMDADRFTAFKGIQQLLPSEALTLDLANFSLRIWKYWDIHPNPDYNAISESDAVDRFRNLLIDSVRIRMRSDVSVGSCLSGGLDSSAIVSIVRKHLHQGADYHTFTGIFPGTGADEWKYAKVVIDDTNVIEHTIEPTSEKLADEIGAFMWHNELPVSSSSQYAQWCVFRLAQQTGITVLLDGQGADELLGGYEQYFRFYLQAIQEQGNATVYGQELAKIKERYPAALLSETIQLREKVPFGLRYFIGNQLHKGTNLLYGLNRRFAGSIKDQNLYATVPGLNPLSAVLYQDSFGRFLTTLLRYGDRNSMAHSREVRLPFCDHRLAELIFSLPPTYLMGDVQTKRMLRESMRGILHEEIRTRWNKQGFRPPQEMWFKGRLMEMARDLFQSESFINSDYWHYKWWLKALKRIESGETGLSWTVWQPFVVQAWKTHFVNDKRIKNKISIFQ
jgi:asparagine synthase (glutamine-hydrolysing)